MSKIKKYKLEIIVFLCGAIGMGLELIASRILSPYVGSSNVVWTSIIGVILLSMSLGYWLGGKKADKGVNEDDLSNILFLSTVFVSIIPILETLIVNEISKVVNNLILAAIICAMAVFSLPSFILAMVSPIVVKIKSMNEENIGTLSGKISSLSTIGSILGTFLMGFLLIPNIGVTNINISISVLLILLGIFVKSKIDKIFIKKVIIFLLIIIILIFTGKYLFKIRNKDIILDTDSQYGRIWVKKLKTSNNEYKTLYVDRGLESYIDNESGKMGAQYLRFYDLFQYFNKDAKDTMLIGGAAYTYPTYYLKKYENKNIDVIEIDEKMTKIAEEHFDLDINNPRLKIYHQDGRTFLNYSKNKYDTILIDAFKGNKIPFELTTYEALVKAKNMLNDNGLVISNIISSVEGKDSNFIKYEYETYKKVFDDVKLYRVSDIDYNEKQNLILVGFKGNMDIDDSKYDEYKNYLTLEVKNYKTNTRILTDDFAPVGN